MSIPPSPIDDNRDLHKAEYAAITNRLTYWITIQYAIYSITAVFIAAVFSVGDKFGSPIQTVLLMTILVYLLLTWGWFQSTCEIYEIALYIETSLKDRFLPAKNTYWCWDHFFWKAKEEDSWTKVEARFGLVIFSVLLLITLLGLEWSNRSCPSGLDLAIIGMTIFVACMLGIKMRSTNRSLKRLTTALELQDKKPVPASTHH